jgi:hypothetical protein
VKYTTLNVPSTPSSKISNYSVSLQLLPALLPTLLPTPLSSDGDDNEGVYGNNSVDGNGGVDGRYKTENSTEEDEIFFGSLMNKYQLIKK